MLPYTFVAIKVTLLSRLKLPCRQYQCYCIINARNIMLTLAMLRHATYQLCLQLVQQMDDTKNTCSIRLYQVISTRALQAPSNTSCAGNTHKALLDISCHRGIMTAMPQSTCRLPAGLCYQQFIGTLLLWLLLKCCSRAPTWSMGRA